MPIRIRIREIVIAITDCVYELFTQFGLVTVLVVAVLLAIPEIQRQLPLPLHLSITKELLMVFIQGIFALIAIVSAIMVASNNAMGQKLWKETIAPFMRYLFIILLIDSLILIVPNLVIRVTASASASILLWMFNLFAVFLVIKAAEEYLNT